MQPGPHGADRQMQNLGYFSKGQVAVVLEHDRRSLLAREPPEGSFELLSIRDR